MALVDRVMRPRNTEITTSADLDAFLRRGAAGWSGISVTAQNAVEVSTVLACTRVIAEDIGKLPAPVYERKPNDVRERATDSPDWTLVHDRPNSWMSSQSLREVLTAWAVLRGDGFALKNLAGNRTRELLPLPHDRVRVEQLSDWELIYHVRLADGKEKTLTKREVFHLRGLSLDGIRGIGIVTLARQTIGTSLAAQRHAAKFFANGLQTSGVFTHPGELSDKAYTRLKESLKEDYSADNVYSPMLLEEGTSWVQTGLSSEDSQFLQSRQFEVVEICRWFRVNPHKVQDFSRAHFNNIEASNLDHVTDTLLPWAKRWEYAYNQQVISTPATHYVELLFDALLRGTTKERFEAYQLAAGGNAPWMSRQEIRRRENLNPIDGLDEMLTPKNMGAVGDEEAKSDAPAAGNPTPEDGKSFG